MFHPLTMRSWWRSLTPRWRIALVAALAMLGSLAWIPTVVNALTSATDAGIPRSAKLSDDVTLPPASTASWQDLRRLRETQPLLRPADPDELQRDPFAQAPTADAPVHPEPDLVPPAREREQPSG